MKFILFVDIVLLLITVINGEFIKSYYKDGLGEMVQNSVNGCQLIAYLLFNDSSNNSITFNGEPHTPIYTTDNNNNNMYKIKLYIPVNNSNNKSTPVYIDAIINNKSQNITLSQPFNCIPINNNDNSNNSIQQNITYIRYDLITNSVVLNLNIYNSNNSIIYFSYTLDNSNNNSNIVKSFASNSSISHSAEIISSSSENNNSNITSNNSNITSNNNNTSNNSNSTSNNSNNTIINSVSNNPIDNNTTTIKNNQINSTNMPTNINNILKSKSSRINNNNNLLSSIQSSLPISANTTLKQPNNKLLIVKFQNIDRSIGVPISGVNGDIGESFSMFINNQIRAISTMNDQYSYQLYINLNCWNLNDLGVPINFQVKDQFDKSSTIQIRYPLDSPVTSIWNLSPPPPPLTTIQTFDNKPVDILIFLSINKTRNPPLYIESSSGSNSSFKILPISLINGNYTIVLKHTLSVSTNFNLSSPILSVKQIPYSIIVNNIIKSNYNIQLLDSQSQSQSLSLQYKSYLNNSNLIIQSFGGTVNSASSLIMSLKTSNNGGTSDGGNYHYKYIYPLGYYFGSSASNYTFKVDHLFVNQFQLFESTFYCGHLEKQVLTTAISETSTIDSRAPELINILVNTSSNSESLVITVYASDDLSGIYEISIADQMHLHYEDIIDGDIRDAVFQSTFEFNSLLFDSQDSGVVYSFIKITDFAGNQVSYRYDDVYNSKFNMIPPLFPDIPLGTIESFKFIPNIIDTSSGSVSVTLFIKSVYIDQTWIPKLSLIYPTIGIYSASSSSSINSGYYDSESGNFLVKFKVPKNSLPGIQDYVFQYPSWNSNYLSSKFGSDSILTIKNSAATQQTSYLGPMIVSVNTSSGGSTIYINSTSINQEIYFEIQLNTNGKAFRDGVINVTSNIDPIPYVFKFTIDDAIDAEKSTFKFKFSISTDCISQEFEITGVELYDESNWRTYYQKYADELNQIINPFGSGNNSNQQKLASIIQPFDNSLIVTSNTISLVCSDQSNLDTIPPELVEFDFNPKVIQNSKDSIIFNFSVKDNSKIYQRRNPVIYLMAENRQPQVIESNIKSIVNSSYIEYQASATISYGYSTRGIIIMVYNLIDTSINFRGYTSLDLIEKSFQAIINVQASVNGTNPSINSYSLGGDNTELVVRGTKLLSNYVLGHFSALDGSIAFDLKPIKILSNQLLFKLPSQELNSKFIALVIEINDIGNFINNSLIITLNNYKSTFKPCGYENGLCNNGGICLEMGCKCINDWYGPDCGSKLAKFNLVMGESWPSSNFIVDLNKQEEQLNSTQSDSLFSNSSSTLSPPPTPRSSLTPSANEIIEAEISFLKIREIDINQDIINEYSIGNKWKVVKSSKFNSVNATSTLYSNVFSATNTPIELIISQFPNYKVDFEFADQSYQLNPHSIKFTISIGQYRFKSPLSTLQVLFNSTIQDKSIITIDNNNNSKVSSCPSKSIGYTNKEKSNLAWISLRINNIGIFGQFIQNGIVDNRVIQLNHNIDEKSIHLTDSSISLLVTISIPNYQNSAIIDPQFSILRSLFGAPYNFDNQCSNNNQSNIFLSKNNLIIFITCFSFGLVLAITTIILCIKYKWWIKYKTLTLYDKILKKEFSDDIK